MKGGFKDKRIKLKEKYKIEVYQAASGIFPDVSQEGCIRNLGSKSIASVRP